MSSRKVNNNNKKNLGNKPSGPKAQSGYTKKNNSQKKPKTHIAGRKVSTPARTERKLVSQGPRSTFLKNGGVRIEMEEFVGPILKPITLPITDGSGDNLIKVFRLRINPGSAKTFTWLSAMAVNYENYKFLKCELQYLTRVGTGSTGSLIMSPDYDAEDGDVPVTEKSVFSNKGTTDEALYLDHTLKLQPSGMHRLYKSHAIMSDERFDTTDQDSKTIDCAQVHVLLDTDAVSAIKYGKLIIKYVVELTEPQNPTDPANKGGVILRKNVSLSPASSFPFVTAPPIKGAVGFSDLNGVVSDVGVMKPLMSLIPSGATLPSAVVGQFIKDYSGLLSMWNTGTGLSSFPEFYVNKMQELNTAAGSAGELIQPLIESTGTTGNQQVVYDITARAGDILKMKSGGGSLLSTLNLYLGGSNTNSLTL